MALPETLDRLQYLRRFRCLQHVCSQGVGLQELRPLSLRRPRVRRALRLPSQRPGSKLADLRGAALQGLRTKVQHLQRTGPWTPLLHGLRCRVQPQRVRHRRLRQL